jgi:hypothetical protein
LPPFRSPTRGVKHTVRCHTLHHRPAVQPFVALRPRLLTYPVTGSDRRSKIGRGRATHLLARTLSSLFAFVSCAMRTPFPMFPSAAPFDPRTQHTQAAARPRAWHARRCCPMCAVGRLTSRAANVRGFDVRPVLFSLLGAHPACGRVTTHAPRFEALVSTLPCQSLTCRLHSTPFLQHDTLNRRFCFLCSRIQLGLPCLSRHLHLGAPLFPASGRLLRATPQRRVGSQPPPLSVSL